MDLLDVSDSKNQPSKKDPIVEPLVFQNIICKRGRPKLSREGRKTPKKTKNSRFIDEVEAIFPKKSSDLENEAIGRKHVRGPYKKNKKKDSETSGSAYSNQSYVDLSNTSGMSSQRPVHKRGPYKTKNKSKMEYSISHQLYQKKSGKKSVLIDDWIEGEDDIPDKRTGGPKRAPRTMQAMQEQYPEVVNSETGIIPENCYTCMSPLNRFAKEYEDQIVHCYICDEANVHRSCLTNCRVCDEKNL